MVATSRSYASLSVAELADALGSDPGALLPILERAAEGGHVFLSDGACGPHVVLTVGMARSLGLARDEAGRWVALASAGDRVPARPVGSDWISIDELEYELADARQLEPSELLA